MGRDWQALVNLSFDERSFRCNKNFRTKNEAKKKPKSFAQNLAFYWKTKAKNNFVKDVINQNRWSQKRGMKVVLK